MKQSSKDPFEVAFEEEQEQEQEQVDSPMESPIAADDINVDTQTTPVTTVEDEVTTNVVPKVRSTSVSNRNPSTRRSAVPPSSTTATATVGKGKEEEEDEEEENMEVELGKFPSTGDPDKMAKMQAILSQFTEEQMSRYESFRRSGFQKANMKKLLASLTGTPKISVPMTIVVSGIAKMFVGELVETGRIVMTERKETGPIRPCHIREAYRRLKLEGKVPKRSVQRLFR